MFSWICPKCKSEVGPSYSECPNCRAREAAAATAVLQGAELARDEAVQPERTPATPVAAAASGVVEPMVKPRPAQSRKAEPPSGKAPAPRMSPAMAGGAAALAIAACLAILYLVVLPRRPASADARGEGQELSTPVSLTAGRQSSSSLGKVLELSGVRLTPSGRRVKAQMLAVNHSGTPLEAVTLEVELNAGGKTVFEFPLTIPGLGASASKEVSALIESNLKPYEWPDWQTIQIKFQSAQN